MIDPAEAARIIRGITRTDPQPALAQQVAALPDQSSAVAFVIAEAGEVTARVAKFYQVFFDRVPDAGGLDFWTGIVRDRPLISDAELARAFFEAGEFEALYGDLPAAEAVEALYFNVLRRPPEPEGLAYWTRVAESNPDGGLEQLGRAFAVAAETEATFQPLIEGFLTRLGTGVPVPNGTALFDLADIPDTLDSPARAAPGEPLTSALDVPGDVDLVGIELAAGRIYEIALRGTAGGGGNLADPLLSLLDAGGALLAVDDGGAANGVDALLSTGLGLVDRLVFAAVESADGRAGSYTLTVEDVTPQDPGLDLLG